jgi:hypothetical protein
MNEIGPILGLVGAVLSLFGLGWMALVRYAVTTTLDGIKAKQTELEAKETKCEGQLERMGERLRLDELETRDIKGRLPTAEVRHDNLARDVEQLQATQVPRHEFERQMNHVFTRLDEILRRLERATPSPGAYGQRGSGESGPFVQPAPGKTPR